MSRPTVEESMADSSSTIAYHVERIDLMLTALTNALLLALEHDEHPIGVEVRAEMKRVLGR